MEAFPSPFQNRLLLSLGSPLLGWVWSTEAFREQKLVQQRLTVGV